MLSQEDLGELNGPLSISIATRNAELRPHFARGFGVRLNEDQTHLTVMVPKAVAKDCLDDIENNRLIATTVAHMSSFKTRQFKGTVKRIADCSEEDYELMKGIRDAGSETSRLFFGSDAGVGWGKYRLKPGIAITFELSELFEQSPGAKAGEKLK
ncbi:hypothetical protein [Leptospira adleri]|uniref:Uncharacterized protein n=1 Tax=Leptospira adleri TaxID=2023186 RepID=A0A2M9YUW8_9LEPT|nr:hypothetical protein [Leptospira adleri]PJZ55337.1 hypothetical protein CH380_00850 [Leptospira adleri]PJZ63846.1 hypothetical protein CH376_01405 [Leptospira adleri]TGM60000.1 hypothetical protein EHQ97_04885 [Leptospira adleri]